MKPIGGIMKRQIPFTLRFDEDLYDRVKVISRREGRTITAFVQEAVAKRLEEEEAAVLFEAFTLVGEDLDEAGVEFACDAQREVVLKGE
jgi:predicted DNA-binding protein